MVEGDRRRRSDSGSHPVNIGNHTPSRDTDDPQPLLAQKSNTGFVPFRPIAPIMRLAIDLDDQSGRTAIAVHAIRPGRMLPPKLRARLPAAQPLP
jgi:hypothetical protein